MEAISVRRHNPETVALWTRRITECKNSGKLTGDWCTENGINIKIYYFANTPRGATASAVMFSIIQTAIANELDPYLYLKHIFTDAPKKADHGEDWITAMLPENVPDSCKAGKK